MEQQGFLVKEAVCEAGRSGEACYQMRMRSGSRVVRVHEVGLKECHAPVEQGDRRESCE